MMDEVDMIREGYTRIPLLELKDHFDPKLEDTELPIARVRFFCKTCGEEAAVELNVELGQEFIVCPKCKHFGNPDMAEIRALAGEILLNNPPDPPQEEAVEAPEPEEAESEEPASEPPSLEVSREIVLIEGCVVGVDDVSGWEIIEIQPAHTPVTIYIQDDKVQIIMPPSELRRV